MNRRQLSTVAFCLLAGAGCPKSETLLDAGLPPMEPDAGIFDAGQPLPDHFVAFGDLKVARVYQTATVLQSGLVLIVGGEDENFHARATAELIDPSAGTVTSLALPAAVSHHTATLLQSGQVLIAGGGGDLGSFYPSAKVTANCWLFDPSTQMFTMTGALLNARSHHTAIALLDGTVLVAGGGGGVVAQGNSMATALAQAEVYDPATQQWTAVGAMNDRRAFHTMNLLPSGHVLVTGGANETQADFASVDDYDPVAKQFAQGPAMAQDRFRHAAAVLSDGSLLVAGGKKANVRFLSEAELLAPGASAFDVVPSVYKGGNGATMVPLDNGHALFVGGYGSFGGPTLIYEYVAQVQRFDLARRAWRQLEPLKTARTLGTVSVLPSGQVLVVGGLGDPGIALKSIEISQPCSDCEALDAGVVGQACSGEGSCAGSGRSPQCRATTSSMSKPYLGGFCTASCLSDGDCPDDSLCGPALPSSGEADSVCWPRCSSSATCRAPAYACYTIDTADAGGCWLADSSAVDAGTPAVKGLVGSACTGDSACQPPEQGTCFRSAIDETRPSGFVGGYCSVDCTVGGTALCGDGAVCLPYTGGHAYCFRRCTGGGAGQGDSADGGCREGEVCLGFADSSDGYCTFSCQNNRLALCGNAACDPSGYCQR